MENTNTLSKVSFEEWLINLNEEFEVPLQLLNSTLRQLADTEEDAGRKEQLLMAINQSSRFGGLMHNLNLAALEQTRKALLRISKVNLNSFVDSVTKGFSLSLDDRSEIHFHSSPDLNLSWIDQDRLHKILVTLISNSIQFAKESGVRIDVSLQKHGNEHFQVVIRDNGIGIVEEKIDHLFDPLYSDDPVHLKLYQSTSAGLYLILLYARAMGGDISVESEKMVYTRFNVRLPIITHESDIPFKNFELVSANLDPKQAYEQGSSYSRDYGDLRQLEFKKKTVLALGESGMWNGFEAYFKSELRLMHGTDGALTIARALHLNPNLIVLVDGDFGEISTRQIATTLKSHEITQKIPLIWISDREKFEGADMNISLSIGQLEIFEKIRDLLELREKLMRDLIDESMKPSSRPKYQNSKEAFLTRLERIVDAHLTREDLDMDKLSEMLYLNRSQIHRKIKSYTGMNTTEYIRNYKLKLAYKDLELQNGTIAEIAYRNGFNSPSYFSKSFKQVFGIAPSELHSELTDESKN